MTEIAKIVARENHFDLLRASVRSLFERELERTRLLGMRLDESEVTWTLQGFGMLRTYLPGNVRLHVWDADFANENVSTLHTHPWDMASTVISGKIVNHRFRCDVIEEEFHSIATHMRGKILCGEGGGLVDDENQRPEFVTLHEERADEIAAGGTYFQGFREIHESEPENGTVTLVRRLVPQGGDPDHAFVFWPKDGKWVTAEPRPALHDEVIEILESALRVWR